MHGNQVDQPLWLCWHDETAAQRYAQLPDLLGVPACVGRSALPDSCRLVLSVDKDGLSLGTWPRGAADAAPTRVDFLDPALRYRLKTTGKRQGLGRALGLGSRPEPTVLDATAGLGRDAMAMAALGCRVCMLERALPVFLLLQDGFERARNAADEALAALLSRMELHHGEARDWCARIAAGELPRPDIVYLDPMFPPRNKSARVKKDIAVLQRLLGSEEDFDGLLEAALVAAARRVVVKRPAGGKAPSQRKPDYTVAGKTASFDVYLSRSAESMPA